MESFVGFEPLTPRLPAIRCPTLIVNGEYDFFTPRETHEHLRRHIANSRLLIIQRAYHAFTLEWPAVTLRQIEVFLRAVEDGSWTGDRSVWVANEDPAGEPAAFPYPFDPLRAIVPPPYAAAAPGSGAVAAADSRTCAAPEPAPAAKSGRRPTTKSKPRS
jgi:3-oxoadipate enol-lactonase